MKTKIILSIIFTILFSAYIFNKTIMEKQEKLVIPQNVQCYPELTLNKAEQETRLQYLLSSKFNIYESEESFREIQTGKIITDDSKYGNGAKVVYCQSGKDKAGYVLKSIIRTISGGNKQNNWLDDTSHNWYIRPRIRVKRDLIYPITQNYNEQNFRTPVCRLEIVNAEGEIITEREYEGRHFWERNPDDECMVYYSGNYREGYGFMFIDSIAMISGKSLNPKNKITNQKTKLDYRIYWYGYTDLWVDCISEENETSYELRNGVYDMWLKAMKEIDISRLEPIKQGYTQNSSYNYLVSRLVKNNNN